MYLLLFLHKYKLKMECNYCYLDRTLSYYFGLHLLIIFNISMDIHQRSYFPNMHWYALACCAYNKRQQKAWQLLHKNPSNLSLKQNCINTCNIATQLAEDNMCLWFCLFFNWYNLPQIFVVITRPDDTNRHISILKTKFPPNFHTNNIAAFPTNPNSLAYIYDPSLNHIS